MNAVRLQVYVALQRLVFNACERMRDIMPQTTLTLSTRGPGLYEFTDMAHAVVEAAAANEGLWTAFVRHSPLSATWCCTLADEPDCVLPRLSLAPGLGRSRMR